MLKQDIQDQVNKFLEDRPDVFVVEFTITPKNEVELVIDGDKGISVQDCLQLSRQVENNVDRDQEDYALKVSSYGATNPLLNPRQYKKNVGRKIELNTVSDEKYKGNLVQADDESIEIEWKERVPKPVGKGKVTQQFNKKLMYNEINKAKIIISFLNK